MFFNRQKKENRQDTLGEEREMAAGGSSEARVLLGLLLEIGKHHCG